MSTEQWTARDARRPGHFWADNEVYDRYARTVGVSAFAVYMALTRYADNDGTCYPSYQTIADGLGTSRRTVIRAIQTLERYELIHIEARRLKLRGQTTNVFTLCQIDKTGVSQIYPGPPTGVSQSHPDTDRGVTESLPGLTTDTGGVSQVYPHINNTYVNKTQLTTPPPGVVVRGGGGDERMESDDDENLPEDSHEVEADIVHLKADLVDALVRAGVRREEAQKTVNAGTVKSDRDVVICKRYLDASGADNPGAVLWSKYLKLDELPPMPQMTPTDPGVIDAARRLSADLDRQRDQAGGPMIDQRALDALKARQARGVLKPMPAKKPAFEWVQP